MQKIILYVIFFACSALPQLSHAWGADGHQSVAAIADALLLNTPAGRHVSNLLAERKLEQVAVWADCVKGIAPAQDYRYTSAGRYPECAAFENPAGIAAMADYVRRNDTNCQPASGEESCHKQYHYADISIEHEHYENHYVGASDHDIVHAIDAAVLVLQGQPAAPPFVFKDPSEALILLSHYVGDLHQPLHVGSVFLDQSGAIIAPDDNIHDANNNTVGGNALQCPCGNLHALWDDLPPQLKRGQMNRALITAAKTIPLHTASAAQLPRLWADEALHDARTVFGGTQFSPRSTSLNGNNWSIALPLEYEKSMLILKQDALARAGAHLAQLLAAIWPE